MNARAFACARCGALNTAKFDRCIRCGKPLKPAPEGPEPRVGLRSAPMAWGSLEEALREDHDHAATKTIVLLNLIIFAGQIFLSLRNQSLTDALVHGGSGPTLSRFGTMEVDVTAVMHAPFSVLSNVFVHFGIIHLGMNMLGLVNLARAAEPAVGTTRFTIAYVMSGLAGSLTTLVVSTLAPSYAVTAGASGAVFGVLGLLLGWLLYRRDPAWKQYAAYAVFYGVLFGFILNASGAGPTINNMAHIGGLICGLIFGLIYARNPVGGPNLRQGPDTIARAMAAVCLGACVVSLVLAQLSPRWRPVPRQEIRPRASHPVDPEPDDD